MYEGLYDVEKGLAPHDARRIGLMTAGLLFPWNRWVHRRVERLHFCDEDSIHHDVSIDFTLPYWFHRLRETKPGEARRQLVPLGFLSKGALVNFSLRDEDDGSLPLLTTPQNAQIAEALLLRLATRALGHEPKNPILCDIRSVVRESPAQAREAFSRLLGETDVAHTERSRLSNDSSFSETASLFVEEFLALSMIEIAPHQRRIVHLSYETSFWENKMSFWRNPLASVGTQLSMAAGRPRTTFIAVPSVSEAASYHLEVEAPDGHTISGHESFQWVGGALITQRAPGGYRRAHFHFTQTPNRRNAAMIVRLQPRQSTIMRPALLTSLIALAATVSIALRFQEIRVAHGDETATAILLVATSIVGLVIARSGESEMATALLLPLRVLAVFPALLAFAAAVIVLSQPSVSTGQTALWFASAGIAASSVLLLRNCYLARGVR